MRKANSTFDAEYNLPRRALRPAEVQRALGIGRTKIFALIKTGELASLRLGSMRLIPVEAIDALLAKASANERET